MPKKVHFVHALATSAAMVLATSCALCESASAQGLLNRIRTRVESRMLLPPPPAVAPANPYGYRPPIAGPYANPALSPQRTRVLATPVPLQPVPQQYGPQQSVPQQYGRSGQSIAPPTGFHEVDEPTFGVEIAPVGFGPNRGLEVRGFLPDSPLPDAGIRPGDVIVSIDGVRTDSMAAMLSARRRISPGDSPMMQIVRGGELLQVRLPVWPADERAGRRLDSIVAAEANSSRTAGEPRYAAKPPLDNVPAGYSSDDDSSVMRSPIEATGYSTTQNENPRNPDLPAGLKPVRPRASLGISARDASPQRGVIVVDVNDGSAGKIAGIEVNDRIVSVAGRLIRDTGGLIREFSLSKPGDSVTLGIVRGDAMRDVVVELGGPDGMLARVSTDASNSTASATKPTDGPLAEGQSTESPSSSGNSLFSGVGSALGNFFSGAPAQQMDTAESTDEATEDQSEQVYELPAPAAEPDSNSSDPLALPEDE